MPDYYAILEVDVKASQEEIKKAYLALIKKYHPDVTQFDKKYSEEKSKLVNEAYSILSNPSKRQEYDKMFFMDSRDNINYDNVNSDDTVFDEFDNKSDNESEFENSEEYNTIVRVLTLCDEYCKLVSTKIVNKNGFEVQNNKVITELYSNFSKFISKDYQYLVANGLIKDVVSDCLAFTFMLFAGGFTWSDNFIKANEIMNIISSFIEPSSALYSKFIEMRDSISKNAIYQKNANRVTKRRIVEKQVSYDDDSPGYLSMFWNSLHPRAKGQFVLLVFIGIIYGFSWLSGLFSGNSSDSSSKYSKPISSVSTQYNKNVTNKTTTPKTYEPVKPVVIEPVKTEPVKTTNKPKTFTPVKGIKTGYVVGKPILNSNGLCRLTIDNSQNREAVYVRLWSTYPSKPIRTFNIAGYDSFTLNNLNPGTYELRYKYLYEEKDATVGTKSDSFDLSQYDTGYGVRYSVSTITLYKVYNGNFRTSTIDVDEI